MAGPTVPGRISTWLEALPVMHKYNLEKLLSKGLEVLKGFDDTQPQNAPLMAALYRLTSDLQLESSSSHAFTAMVRSLVPHPTLV